MHVTCLTANLGTQQGVQAESVHALQALEHLFAASLTVHTRAPRVITRPALLQDVHGIAARYKLQPQCAARNTQLFVGAYQESVASVNLQKPWSDKGWLTLQNSVNDTVIVLASKGDVIPRLWPARLPASIADRCAVLAAGAKEQPAGAETRSADHSDVLAVFVSYHGPRSMKPGDRAEHLKTLCTWMGDVCRKHGVPVWVLGDFNYAWSACERVMPDLPDVRLRLLPAVPHRRLKLDDTCPHGDTIDFALVATPATGSAAPCESGESFDLADPCRHAVSGMQTVLPSGFFDHDAVVWHVNDV